jgi:hypothetical protein
MLPQGNAVPETVYDAKQTICLLGLKIKKINACKNDCILYRGAEYEDHEKCPICGLFLKCVQFLKPYVQFLMDTILKLSIVQFLMKKKGDTL